MARIQKLKGKFRIIKLKRFDDTDLRSRCALKPANVLFFIFIYNDIDTKRSCTTKSTTSLVRNESFNREKKQFRESSRSLRSSIVQFKNIIIIITKKNHKRL